ncbi:MAG TPA: RHS repeat-associated core domain-containing protein [Terriglobales bacterium]|nr:RHS repeat-associated core domain-containing protein [Terriglobales bacterium]
MNENRSSNEVWTRTKYVYDGDGNRVKKNAGVLYWGTGPLAESDLAGTITSDYIYFNGKRIARVDPSCCGGQPAYRYYFSDHLGSASVVTNETVWTILEESDYYPYGGERVIVDNDPNHFKFTGKERDTETGLDYFGARYHVSTVGRFLSPDPGNASAEQGDPQSWNGYAYAGNNPLTFTDPDGMNYKVCDNEGKNCADLKDEQFQQYLKDNDKVSITASGKLEITLPDGAKQTIGTATYYNEKIPQMFDSVERMAGLPVRATAAATMTFVQMAGPGILNASRAGLEFGSIGISRAGEVLNILQKARSVVGNQGITVSSREAAEQAAKEWVGQGARPITDRVTGKVVGQISADGTKVARYTSAHTKGYINLVNKATGGNLHVRW